MKHLYFLICLISFSVCNAQDPRLFENTWYLYSMQATDLDTEYIVSEIEPRIDPYLIINESLEFNGEGACNTFTGLYELTSQDQLTAINFSETGEDCGVQRLNSFESSYFSFIATDFWFSISQDGNGNVLTMGNMLFGYALFKSYPLSTSEFNKNEFQIYPNPVKDKLILSSSKTGLKVLKTKIYTITGKLLSTQNVKAEKQVSLDISNLSSGIYFLNIEDENGNIETKKFIKE